MCRSKMRINDPNLRALIFVFSLQGIMLGDQLPVIRDLFDILFLANSLAAGP